MSKHKKRIDTLVALVLSSSIFNDPATRSEVADELIEIRNLAHMQPLSRRRLFRFLHVVRALETTLSATAVHGGIIVTNQERTLGGYLLRLSNCTPPRLPHVVRMRCQTKLVSRRNVIFHTAGAYPAHDMELDEMISVTQECMTWALR